MIPLFFFLVSCSPKTEENRFTLPENVLELVAGKKSKTWKLAKRTNGNTRVNMGKCTLDFRLTFSTNYTFKDETNNPNCGPFISGVYGFVLDKNKNVYLNLKGEHIAQIFEIKNQDSSKYFQIIDLSDSVFIYRYSHKLFSDKTTIIEDVLVPEEVDFEGREFHY